MAPVAHTLYSVNLFLALVALKLWCERRHRVSLSYRAGLSKVLNSCL